MKKSGLKTTIVAAMGAGFVASPTAQAAVTSYDFNAVLTKLASQGSATYPNAGRPIPIIKGTDQYQSHLTGTLMFDTTSGTGTAVFEPFQFDHYSLAEITDYTMQAIGDGVGGTGTLMLTNFLVDAYLVTDMPVSMIHDAAGFLAGELTAGGVNSAMPASDGTIFENFYTDGSTGRFSLGPAPIATTAWNTTNDAGCFFENCLGVAASGALPLIFDDESNTFDNTANTGGAVGGSPVQDGRYITQNVNLDFTSMTVVPIPASVWLFGSGILGLIGIARKKVRT